MVPHRARQVRAKEYANWDLIIGMDSANMRNLRRIFEREPEAQADDCAKLIKLLSLTGSDRDVADPWYTGNFDVAAQERALARRHAKRSSDGICSSQNIPSVP